MGQPTNASKHIATECALQTTQKIEFLRKPENYDPSQYELLARILDAGWKEVFWKFDRIPNRKD